MTLASRLPEYPWDGLAPIAEKAAAFPGGAVDLSIGTPVDPVPSIIQDALIAAANAPGYPLTAGTPGLRSAAAGWLARSLGVQVDPGTVLPVIGTKEFIAWLPVMLGLGPADTVIYPSLAYPTYDIGARFAGAASVAADALSDAPESTRLVWVNSPSNPTGRVLTAPDLREAVEWAARPRLRARLRRVLHRARLDRRRRSRCCTPRSAVTPSTGVLAVFSLSKRSNLAGYRAGFVTGDPALMKQLLLVCRQAGLIMPAPVQAAMTVALSDDAHAAEQKARYAARRSVLAAGADRGRVPHRPLPGRALPVGDQAGARQLGRVRAARDRVRHPGRARVPVRADRERAHPGRADRDRRARRHRRRAAATAGGLEAPETGPRKRAAGRRRCCRSRR